MNKLYRDTVYKIVCSNIGSFEKEDLVNNCISKNEEDDYYYSIIRILDQRTSTFIKKKRLYDYLKRHNHL